MTHVGQELRLDPAGFLRTLARHVQLDVLNLDGFQRLAQVLGCLIHVLLKLTLRALQGACHGIDALGQIIQLAAALFIQTHIKLTFADLGDGAVGQADRVSDTPAHLADGESGQQ